MNRELLSHPPVIVVFSVIVLALDYLTGPEIHFPIVFALPVVLASWHRHRALSVAIAVVLPAFRIAFGFAWGDAASAGTMTVNYLIRVIALAGLALLVNNLAMLSREFKVLRGILPICSNCKKIRTESGAWSQLEAYISENSEAEFSHGMCNECARRLYPGYFAGRESAADSDAEPHEDRSGR